MTSMLQRIAAAAACALLLACPASAQLIGSGHVMGNGTSSPAAPTDTALSAIMNQTGSGMAAGVAGVLGAPPNTSGGVATLGAAPVNGQCMQFNSSGKAVPAGGACSVGGGGGTVNSGTKGQGAGYNAAGNAVVGVDDCNNFELWGGVGNGTTDNTAAWGNLTAALTAGGCSYFPTGKYEFLSAISYTVPGASAFGAIKLKGDGSENTILYWPSGNGLTLTMSNFRQVAHVEGLTLSTGTAVGTNTALTLTTPTFSFADPMHTIEDVFIRGDDGGAQGQGSLYWGTGIHIHAVNNVSMNRLTINGGPGDLGTGVKIEGDVTYTTNPYAFNYYMNSAELSALQSDVSLGDYFQGLFVTNSAFAGVGGITLNGTAGVECCVLVSNSQFNNTIVSIAENTSAPLLSYQISNNLFFVNQSGIGINFPHDGGGTITGNSFGPQGAITAGSAIALAGTVNGYGSAISGNWFNALPTGLDILSTAERTNVVGNTFTNTATPITNSGTTQRITDNIGYNPVGNSSAAYPLASNATYLAGASPETHYLTDGTAFSVVLPSIGAICNSVTSCQVTLGPHEAMAITYVVAPQDAKSIH